MNKQIHNIETGEVVIVPLTDEEIAAQEAISAEITQQFENRAAAKAAAETKLAALGLTADDLKALGL